MSVSCSIAPPSAIGDPMNGAAFDLFGSYRPLFLMMAVYTALAFVAVLRIPRGTGEAAHEVYADRDTQVANTTAPC